VIEMLADEYPISVACQVLGCPRSSYYYQSADKDDETALKAAIKAEAARWPTYGYRRITAQLRRGNWWVNRKRVQRLMRLMDLQAQIQRRKQRTTNSEHDFLRYPNLVQDLEVVQPE
jgi:putative transposase